MCQLGTVERQLKCEQCGSQFVPHKNAFKKQLEFDHKIPLCEAGPDTVKNLQAICRRCNGLKAATTSPEIVIGGWIEEQKLCNVLT